MDAKESWATQTKAKPSSRKVRGFSKSGAAWQSETKKYFPQCVGNYDFASLWRRSHSSTIKKGRSCTTFEEVLRGSLFKIALKEPGHTAQTVALNCRQRFGKKSIGGHEQTLFYFSVPSARSAIRVTSRGPVSLRILKRSFPTNTWLNAGYRQYFRALFSAGNQFVFFSNVSGPYTSLSSIAQTFLWRKECFRTEICVRLLPDALRCNLSAQFLVCPRKGVRIALTRRCFRRFRSHISRRKQSFLKDMGLTS